MLYTTYNMSSVICPASGPRPAPKAQVIVLQFSVLVHVCVSVRVDVLSVAETGAAGEKIRKQRLLPL